jgi:hypothetical protein
MAGWAVKGCIGPPARWDHLRVILLLGRAWCVAAPGFCGAAGVCPQGRAERALAVPGGPGQVVLPGRDEWTVPALPCFIFEGGAGVRGQRPCVFFVRQAAAGFAV